jgi:hypothetical protein
MPYRSAHRTAKAPVDRKKESPAQARGFPFFDFGWQLTHSARSG